ncbi:DEAD (Asp-Glu-Ala-Asp) box polypeptide 59 [Apophysomyces sp. BC1034]|nr:DEAD (Asp-Glu-Ala-Asp) box polypeptide 59 [Apophysomyces sp. BC1015]KAG0179975.1 DEAD (Asp-Glu-Ala-Asp) box polypeptide 59 [Apophysomyces sp. BC1021]KAG0190515.1 DEAD (Asp-Glu-Ala-Asp) box polypeptide 59 [Apophysomyces sp. BC1034]
MFIPRSIKRKHAADLTNSAYESYKKLCTNGSLVAESVLEKSSTGFLATGKADDIGSSNDVDFTNPEETSAANVHTQPFADSLICNEDNDSDEGPIKMYSHEQRLVDPGGDEPTCIICGKYGEYINDSTDNDVCSLECKQVDTDLRRPKRQRPAWMTDNATVVNYSVAENVHAKMTNYQEAEEVAKMSRAQVAAMLKAHEIEVKGHRIPNPISSFDQCRNVIGDTLLYNLDQMGWSMATGIQRQAVPAGLAGRDVYAIAPTSSGKTGAFLIPILVHCQALSVMHEYKRRAGPYALILAPTRELCQQIEGVAKTLARGMRNTRTALLIGGQPLENQLYRLRKGVQILIGTPGRVQDIITYHPHLCRPWKLHMVVLDEADAMFGLGFGHQVRQILGKLPDTTVRQTSYYSATVNDPKTMEKLCRRLTSPVEITLGQVKHEAKKLEMRSDVRQTILWVENASKAKKLIWILKNPNYFAAPVLIFVDSRLGSEFLTRAIQKRLGHLRVVAMHADKPQEERAAIVAGINEEEPQWDVIVSTDVLARGVDLPFVRLVINYDMTASLDDYVHRIGRAVVRGPLTKDTKHQWGRAITFINNEHKHLFDSFVKLLANKTLTQVTPLPTQLKRYL